MCTRHSSSAPGTRLSVPMHLCMSLDCAVNTVVPFEFVAVATSDIVVLTCMTILLDCSNTLHLVSDDVVRIDKVGSEIDKLRS